MNAVGTLHGVGIDRVGIGAAATGVFPFGQQLRLDIAEQRVMLQHPGVDIEKGSVIDIEPVKIAVAAL
jgi:hypothetical protein